MAAWLLSYHIRRLPLASTMPCCIKAAPPSPLTSSNDGADLAHSMAFTLSLSHTLPNLSTVQWRVMGYDAGTGYLAHLPNKRHVVPLVGVAWARQDGHDTVTPVARQQHGTGARRALPLSQRGWATPALASTRPC